MPPEEKIRKAEEDLNRAKKRVAEAKREASKVRRNEENQRKYVMGGLVAKYLREEMGIHFMDLAEEEIIRIIAFAMKNYEVKNIVKTVIREREKNMKVKKTEMILIIASVSASRKLLHRDFLGAHRYTTEGGRCALRGPLHGAGCLTVSAIRGNNLSPSLPFYVLCV